MKLTHYIYLALIIALLLSGCKPASLTVIPTQAEIQPPSPTFIQPTAPPAHVPTETATMTPPATLEPEKAKATIITLLQEPEDCQAPCFWGIVPEQTTLDEAQNIFAHLGLQVKSTTFQGKDFYGVAYDFEDGLSIIVTLTVVDAIVTDLRVDIHPEPQKSDIAREWLAYSPETLIKRYGSPSKMDFFVGRGPNPLYFIDMYFDTVDLIIHYNSYEIYSNMQICPLTDQMDNVRIWLGKNPMYPPIYDSEVIPLEEAVSMTLEDFSDLMKGDPNKACFILDAEKFP